MSDQLQVSGETPGADRAEQPARSRRRVSAGKKTDDRSAAALPQQERPTRRRSTKKRQAEQAEEPPADNVQAPRAQEERANLAEQPSLDERSALDEAAAHKEAAADTAQPDAAAPAAGKRRRGRARSSSNDETAPERAPQASTTEARPDPALVEAPAIPDAPSAKPPRRRHHDRRDAQQARAQSVSGPASAAPAQSGATQQPETSAQGHYQRDRQFGGGSQKSRGSAPSSQQQGRKGGKDKRPSREAAQPQTNREDLEGMHVADLRVRAVELGVDPVGLKKAELVDAIYRELVKQEGFFEFKGILDIGNDGTGYVRIKSYLPSESDVYVPSGAVRANGLRKGDEVEGVARSGRPNDKYAGLNRVVSVNGRPPEGLSARPRFGDLTPVFPTEPLRMEHGRDSILGRCIDLVAPIGKGQRGLIVSPPKAGKTTVLKKIAESIAANNPEVHLICLLVDERPEEVTDMQRSIKGEVVASTFDMPSENHITVSELVIERAKRLVELGEDVVILLDSITRLARAYNLAQPASGRILSGGVDSTALYPPKRFLGAARNIEYGGSLTILASALVDTGSKMDEVIFEEFKGTGNMELKLDRDLADRRIFPAIDPIASGTRKEELLIDSSMAPFIWGIRRVLANMNSNERAMSSLIKSLKATENNEEFLIRSAKKAQLQELNGDL